MKGLVVFFSCHLAVLKYLLKKHISSRGSFIPVEVKRFPTEYLATFEPENPLNVVSYLNKIL